MALNEEYFYDDEGRLKNASLLDYRLPTSLDVPMLETVVLESPNPAPPVRRTRLRRDLYCTAACGYRQCYP